MKLFVADWCHVCTEVKELIAKNKPKCEIEFVNVDENSELADKLGIDAVPQPVTESGEKIDLNQFMKQCILEKQ